MPGAHVAHRSIEGQTTSRELSGWSAHRSVSHFAAHPEQLVQTITDQIMQAVALPSSMKSLAAKLASIHADPGGAKDFILADAKDADMAFGLRATGKDPATGRARSLEEFRDHAASVCRTVVSAMPLTEEKVVEPA